MGLSIKKLINSIFGKKQKGASEKKITNEVRIRAQELGITPEEYLQLTQLNSSVWNASSNNFNSGYQSYYNNGVEEKIDTVLNNLNAKREKYGISKNAQRPSLFITQNDVNNSQTVKDAETEANTANEQAANFFQNIASQVDYSNFLANNAVEQAQQTADQNNQAAVDNLNATKDVVTDNNTRAQEAQDAAIAQADANNAQAQESLQTTKNQADTNNQNAQQNTQKAQSEKERAVQNETSLQQSLTTAEQNLTAAENAIKNAEEVTPELSAQVENARKERDRIKAELEEATKKRQEAEQKLNSAQQEEQKIKQEGEQKVNEANQQVQTTEAEGEQSVSEAKDNTEQVKQEGEETLSEAQTNVDQVASDSANEVKAQQDNAAQVRKEGNEQKADAQANVKKTEQEGKKDVKDTKNQVKTDLQQAQTEATQQISQIAASNAAVENGTNSSNSTKYDLGHRTENHIKEELQKQNPNATEADVKNEFDKMMQSRDARNLENAQKCFNSNPQEAMLNAANARFEQEKQQGKSTKVQGGQSVDLPDGVVNSQIPYQMEANNCWAQSGVTSIGATQDGSNMLKQHIYRDSERGVTSVHLQEAQDNGNGYNKTGVYTFTDKEIAEASRHFGIGDGDNTAYMLAAEKYLQEKGENSNGRYASDYNSNMRMYEMISGTKGRQCLNSNYINTGITWGDVRTGNMYDYGTLRDGIKSGNVAGTIAIGTSTGGHSLSIVGVASNGNLLVQDPINDGQINNRYNFVDKYGRSIEPFKRTASVNGAPTYEFSKDMYEKYARDCGVYRWA